MRGSEGPPIEESQVESSGERRLQLLRMFEPPPRDSYSGLSSDKARTIATANAWKGHDHKTAVDLFSRALDTAGVSMGPSDHPQFSILNDGTVALSTRKSTQSGFWREISLTPEGGRIAMNYLEEFRIPLGPTILDDSAPISNLVRSVTGADISFGNQEVKDAWMGASAAHTQAFSASCTLGRANNPFKVLTALGLARAAYTATLLEAQRRISRLTQYPMGGEPSYKCDGTDLGLLVGDVAEEGAREYLSQRSHPGPEFERRVNVLLGSGRNNTGFLKPVVIGNMGAAFGSPTSNWRGRETVLEHGIPELQIEKIRIIEPSKGRDSSRRSVDVPFPKATGFSFYYYGNGSGELFGESFSRPDLWQIRDLNPRIEAILKTKKRSEGGQREQKSAPTQQFPPKKADNPLPRVNEPKVKWTLSEALNYLSIDPEEFENASSRDRMRLANKARSRLGSEFHPDVNRREQDGAHMVTVEINKAADFLINNYCREL